MQLAPFSFVSLGNCCSATIKGGSLMGDSICKQQRWFEICCVSLMGNVHCCSHYYLPSISYYR